MTFGGAIALAGISPPAHESEVGALALRQDGAIDAVRTATRDCHLEVETLVVGLAPFASVRRYGEFLKLQHAFLRFLEPLYRSNELAAVIPGLKERSRLAAVEADLSNLGASSDAAGGRDCPSGPVAFALGRLYVAEGSKLGAALLLQQARALGFDDRHGARHMAAPREGRARHWRRFCTAVDAWDSDLGETSLLVAGARAEFERFAVLAKAFAN